MTKYRSPRQKLVKYLDTLWPVLTKNIYGRVCRWCGSTKDIQSDHIVNRWKHNVRWLIENCIILCMPCHLFRKKRYPAEWAALVIKDKGQDEFERLNQLGYSQEPVDLEAVKNYLEEIQRNKPWEKHKTFGEKA